MKLLRELLEEKPERLEERNKYGETPLVMAVYTPKRSIGVIKTVVEREVPAPVDTETWDGAQLTLARNRVARPDIVKRPYPLRGLMKCAHCGHSFVGTVSQRKEASRLSESEREGVELRGEFALRPYYICNGRNWHCKAFGAPGCPSGHIRAKELEELVWGEVESFLDDPEGVIRELSSLLRQRLGEGEQNALYRLFRKGMLPETDLESQLGELREEESATATRLEKIERAVEKAKDARSSLDGARWLLGDMGEQVEASDSWGSRHRVIENLVAGVGIETHFEG